MPSSVKSSSSPNSRPVTPVADDNASAVPFVLVRTPSARAAARPTGMPGGRPESPPRAGSSTAAGAARMPPRQAAPTDLLRGRTSASAAATGAGLTVPGADGAAAPSGLRRTGSAGALEASATRSPLRRSRSLGDREITPENITLDDVRQAHAQMMAELRRSSPATSTATPEEAAGHVEHALAQASREFVGGWLEHAVIELPEASVRPGSARTSGEFAGGWLEHAQSEVVAEGERAIAAFVEGGPAAAPAAAAAGSPQHELAVVLHEAAQHPAFPPQPGEDAQDGRFRRAAAAVVAVITAITTNSAQSTPVRLLNSGLNVGARNMLGVYLPTLLRQYISQGIQERFNEAGTSHAVRTALGAVMPSVATGALAAGAIRDTLHSQPTTTSVVSRSIMGGLTAAVGVGSGVTGAMADSAALMLAFTCYTAMRDLAVQSWLRLDNPDSAAHEAAGHAQDWRHYAMISVLYGLYQGLVSLGMDLGASPSGAGAAGLGLPAAAILAHAALRGAMNFAGEVGEDLTFQGIPAIRSAWAHHNDPSVESRPLRLGIHAEPSVNNLLNGLMGGFAVRTGILSMTLGAVTMLTEPGSALRNPLLIELAGDLIIGVTNALLYHPFANAGSAQPTSRPRDLEMAALPPAANGAGDGAAGGAGDADGDGVAPGRTEG